MGKEVIKSILQTNIYMNFATASNNTPWIPPVFYSFNNDLNLSWYPGKNAQHSRFIKKNPQIATATELEAEDELRQAIETYFARSKSDSNLSEGELKNINDFLGESKLRMYKAAVSKMSVLSESEVYHGKSIDHRDIIKP